MKEEAIVTKDGIRRQIKQEEDENQDEGTQAVYHVIHENTSEDMYMTIKNEMDEDNLEIQMEDDQGDQKVNEGDDNINEFIDILIQDEDTSIHEKNMHYLMKRYCMERGIQKVKSFFEQETVEKIYDQLNKNANQEQIVSKENIQHFMFSLSAVFLKEAFQPVSTLEEPEVLSTGTAGIDYVLHGGLRTGMITQIAGSPGVGKTQLGMQIALQTMMPKEIGGLEGRPLYIYTGGMFPIARLKQYIRHRMKYLTAYNENIDEDLLLETFHVGPKLSHYQAFEDYLYHNVEHYVEKHQVRSIIIDDIATIYRSGFTNDGKINAMTRARHFNKLGSFFNGIAKKFKLVIVILNQVTGTFSDNLTNSVDISLPMHPILQKIKPALGLGWERHIHVNCMCFTSSRAIEKVPLDKEFIYPADEQDVIFDGLEKNVFALTHASYGVKRQCIYKITANGVTSQ